MLSPSELDLVASQPTNSSAVNEAESGVFWILGVDDFQSPYHVLYCSCSIFAAGAATLYFLLYHCCLKKKCLAPNYRKNPVNQPPLVHGELSLLFVLVSVISLHIAVLNLIFCYENLLTSNISRVISSSKLTLAPL